MRKLLVGIAVASLAACSSTKPQPQPVQAVQPVAAAPQASMANIPAWFTEVPKNDDYIYAVGDGVSGSVSGAIGNARANAFEGICQGAGGTVRSQTKIFRQDTETNSSSVSTTAIRNLCADISVAGATVEKSSIIVENGRYRAFVLVALPLGDKNKVTKAQREQASANAVKTTAEREFRELDAMTGGKQTPEVRTLPGLPHETISDPTVKSKVDAAIERGNAIIVTDTVR